MPDSDGPRRLPTGPLPPMADSGRRAPSTNDRRARGTVDTDAPRGTPPTKRKRTAGDRFAVLNGFVDFSMRDLTRAELATWFVLYRDTRGGTASVSVRAIAERVGGDPRTVSRALRSLRRRGLVAVVFRGGLNRGVSRYRVRAIAKPPE